MSRPPLNFSRRAHREGDEQLLLELLGASFGAWPKVEITCDAIDHLRWKGSSTPEAPGLHRITEVDGRPASSVLCWVHNVCAGGETYRAIQGVDRVAHPDFQRSGLGDAIMRWRRAHPEDQLCDFQFGPRSGHPAQLVLHQRAQQEGQTFPLANRIRVLTLPLRDGDGAPIDRAAPARTPVDSAIRAVGRFDARIDGFFQRAVQPYDFIVERSEAYMNWRYADPRAGRFSIRLAERDRELLGYSTLRVSHGRGYIADLLTLPDRLDVASALLDDGIAHLAALSPSRIDWWVPVRHAYQPLARERGFTDKRIVDIDIFPHNPVLDLAFLAEPSVAIHISAGDTDLV